jgi:hypothetical protein
LLILGVGISIGTVATVVPIARESRAAGRAALSPRAADRRGDRNWLARIDAGGAHGHGMRVVKALENE